MTIWNTAPTQVQDRERRWRGRREVIETLGSFISSMAALVTALAASGAFVFFALSYTEDFRGSSDAWQARCGWDGGWRNDRTQSGWLARVSPAPHGHDLRTGEFTLETLWAPPDTCECEATFRLTFAARSPLPLLSARLVTLADDDQEVFINGLRPPIVSDQDRKAGPLTTTDLTQLVAHGPNVLIVHVINRRETNKKSGRIDGHGYFAADLRLQHGFGGGQK